MAMKTLAMKTMSRMLLRVRRRAGEFLADCRGIAATEFAVIVPLMLVMFFGTVEFSSGVAVDRKVSLVTQELADLVSRNPSIADTDIANFTTIANAMLAPYSTTPLKATISELY